MIELLVGMIASGKTTYARTRADEGAIVVSHDDLAEMLHTRYRYEAELKPMYLDMLESLATHALHEGRVVIVDRTHLTREARARWIRFARERSSPIEAVVFPQERAWFHAVRRFKSDARGRTQEEWYNVARHHEQQAFLEPIMDDEGFDKVRYHPPVAANA